MSETPFMPLWVADFVGDTLDLDAKEVGAYMLILMTMWGRDGYLPNDQKKLQRVARCGRDWPRVWSALAHYFTVDGDRITQGRLLLELQKVATKREVNAQSGARGGRAKALKSNEQTLADASVSLQQPEPYLEPYRNTEAKASDASVDFAKAIWVNGTAFLARNGSSEKQARTIIGKWRKAYQDTDIFEAFAACSKQGVIDPVPWITARLSGKGKADGTSKGERKLQSWLEGASIASRVDFGPDTDPSQPLLAGR